MCVSKYFILLIVQLVSCKNIPQNNSAVLISKYSKVQRYGPTGSATGRSNGQSLWTHRSDANVVSGQNVKKGATIYYGISKKNDVKKENVPGIGEVIVQERFNPKPYFEYSQIPPKSNNIQAPNPPPQPAKSPVYQPPQPSKAPAVDLYTSPYSSYNPPPPPPPENSKNKDNSNSYPPLDSNGPKDSYAAPPPPLPDSGSYYQSEKASSLGPPLAPPYEMDNYFKMNDEGAPEDSEGPPEDPEEPDAHFKASKDSAKAPNRPPKSEDDIYYPPDDKETILDHPPSGYKPDMAEDDLSPPPSAPHPMVPAQADDSHAFHDQPRFPQYLYDHPHYDDHHVYEEVSPPTTPKAEDERVNKGHFSYYHLGRKLWYIPLYFSVYFIIYITVLILKSIARHKIEFKHNLHDHFHRKARGMDLNNSNASASATVDHLHRNVTNGINNFQKRYQNSFMK